MKKIIALVLALVCALALVACSNAEPEIITKTCTGEVTSIDLDEEVLTVLDEKTNEEISFTISLLLPHSRDTAISLILLVVSVLVAGGISLHRYLIERQYDKLAQAVHATDPAENATTAPSPAATENPTEAPVQAVTEPSTEATTVPETEPQPLPLYVELHGKNPDYFAWLQIEDTVLDYPIMHTPEDPEKYLHLSFEGDYYYGGTPFMDYRCSADSDNLVIYGHNMLSGMMFRKIIQYEDKNYWEEHPTIRLLTEFEEKEYEVLSVFRDRVYSKHEDVFKFYNFIDAEDEAAYYDAIANFKAKAIYDTGVEPEYGDQLITLVTCAYHTENGRFVVVACEKNSDN